MFPVINGKLLIECVEDDLKNLIGNVDYRESEFLEYKVNFSFLALDKNDSKRIGALAEFRSDVCSFANAQGGFLVYGVDDDRGMANSVIGIDISDKNVDRFELERKNNLNAIMPKIPPVKFHFIQLGSGKYVVVLFVQHDAFSPYIHRENENDYKIFKRTGNGKQAMNYIELKHAFNQSLSLEETIRNYREKRIRNYTEQEDTSDYRYSRFMLLHIIPDTFTDSYHDRNIFSLDRSLGNVFSGIFESFGCNGRSIPNVDGLRYTMYRGESECLICNNNVAECYLPLHSYLDIGNSNFPKGRFPVTDVMYKIVQTVSNYISIMPDVLDTRRMFVGVSVIGCKGAETDKNYRANYNGYIDRNTVICKPIEFVDISDKNGVERSVKLLQVELMLALGVKSEELIMLVAELMR